MGLTARESSYCLHSLSVTCGVTPTKLVMARIIAVCNFCTRCSFISAFASYINAEYGIRLVSDLSSFCIVYITTATTATLCSTLFILNMTFERFYSIIRPHKAASFNTMKRAKLTITGIVVFSIIYRIPQIFISSHDGKMCVNFGKAMDTIYGELYFWTNNVLVFLLPSVLLIGMNSVIINTLYKRSKLSYIITGQGQGHNINQGQGQGTKIKMADKHIIAMLLCVTSGFLIFVTPGYVMLFYTFFVKFHRTPEAYAGFELVRAVGLKMYYTNFGINFYLYVISGKKFRRDLVKLFEENFFFCKKKRQLAQVTVSSVYTL